VLQRLKAKTSAVGPAHAPDQQAKTNIFISYSRKDMAFADRLEAALKGRGLEPLIDRTEIYAFGAVSAPNTVRDAIVALEGLVETDWLRSPLR